MREFECKICNKKFISEESLNQHEKAKHVGEIRRGESNKKSMKKYFLIFLFVIAIIIFAYTFYIRSLRPGAYDELAKCLTEKGAVIYGNDFCQYTTKQLNDIGKSKKYLNYVKCIDEKELCDTKGVKTTPTWEINNKFYEGVQSFEKLATLTGCGI